MGVTRRQGGRIAPFVCSAHITLESILQVQFQTGGKHILWTDNGKMRLTK